MDTPKSLTPNEFHQSKITNSFNKANKEDKAQMNKKFENIFNEIRSSIKSVDSKIRDKLKNIEKLILDL